MIRAASVYARDRQLFIHADVRTHGGLWLPAPPFRVVRADASDGALLKHVVATLRASPTALIPCPPLREAFQPLLRLARVRSWAAFAKNASAVGVRADESWCVVRAFRKQPGDADTASLLGERGSLAQLAAVILRYLTPPVERVVNPPTGPIALPSFAAEATA